MGKCDADIKKDLYQNVIVTGAPRLPRPISPLHYQPHPAPTRKGERSRPKKIYDVCYRRLLTLV